MTTENPTLAHIQVTTKMRGEKKQQNLRIDSCKGCVKTNKQSALRVDKKKKQKKKLQHHQHVAVGRSAAFTLATIF